MKGKNNEAAAVDPIDIELQEVDARIAKLLEYKEALLKVKYFRQELAGKPLMASAPYGCSIAIKVPECAQELYRPEPVPSASATFTEGPVPKGSGMNTLEMTRTVLRNANGEPLTLEELRKRIHTTYGLQPAKTLDQMLYRRAAAKQGFYKDEQGRFGLLEPEAKIETLPVSTTAIA